MSNLKFGLQLELKGDQVVVRGLENARGSVKGFRGEVEQSAKDTGRATEENKKFSSSFNAVSSTAKALGGVLVALGVGKLAGEFISVNREAQKLKASLATVTGSVEAGNAAWREMEKFATTTPFALEQSVNAFVKMKALGLDPTTSALTSFGNTAAAMGKDLNQMIEAVADASTSEFERLKEFGIKASQEGDKVSLTFQGVTTTIGNNSREVVQYLESIGNVQFAGAMERQMDTLDGAISNLQDSIQGLMRANDGPGGASGSVDTLTSAIKGLSDTLNDPAVKQGMQDLVSMTLNLVAAGAQAIPVLGFIGAEIKSWIFGPQIGDLVRLGDELERLQEKRREFQRGAIRDGRNVEEDPRVHAIDQEINSTRQAITLSENLISIRIAGKRAADGFAASVQGVASATGAESEAAKKIIAGLKEQQQELSHTGRELLEFQLISKGASEKQIEMALSTYDNVEALKTQEEQSKENEKAAQDLAKAQDALLKSLFPLEAKQAEIADQLKMLDGLYQDGRVSTDQYREAKAKLQQQLHELNNPLAQTIANIKEETQWLQQELTATLQGDTALKAFNRTKAIETELRRHNVERGSDEERMLRDEIAARYDAAQAIDDYKSSQDNAAESAREANRIQEQFITEIVGSFIDGTGDIGDAFEDLWKRIVREFINSGVASLLGFDSANTPLLSGIGQLLGGGGGSGGSGMDLSSLTSLSSIATKLTGGIAAIGATFNKAVVGLAQFAGLDNFVGQGILSTGGNMAVLGNSLGLGPQTAMMGGALASAGLGWAGGVGGTAIGEKLFNKQAESAWGATIGAAIGTAILPGIGSVIGGALGGIVDAIGGGDGKKRVQLGVDTGDYNYREYAVGNTITAASGIKLTARNLRAGTEGDAVATAIRDEFVLIDAALVDLFKSVTGEIVDFTGDVIGKNTSVKQGENQFIGFFGADGFNGLDPAEIAAASEQFVRQWVDAANEELKTSLDIDGFIELQRAGEPLYQMLARVTQQLPVVNQALEALGFNALAFSADGMAAADGLVAAMGGIENFAASTNQFYSDYYTEAEKTQRITDELTDIFGSLNLAMPDTRAEFRALVEGLDVTTTEGQQTFSALMAVQGAFAQITPAAGEASSAIAGMSDTMRGLQSDTQKLEAELLRAQGLTDQYTAAIRAIETQGMTPAEMAIYDYNNALRDQISSLDAAADAERKLAASRYNMETQILQMTGQTDKLRQRELAALDPALRSMQELMWSIEDQNAAKQAAGNADQLFADFARAQSSYANSLGSLNNSLDNNSNVLSDLVDSNEAWRQAAAEMSRAAMSLTGVLADFRLSDLSPMSAGDRMAFAESEYNRVLQSAQSGNIDAMNMLAEAARDYLTEAQHYYASGAQYASIFNEVAGDIGPLGASGGRVPQFADGGVHDGGWRVVGERGPELEFTGASRIYSNSDSRALFDDSRIVQKLDQILTENKLLKQEISVLRGERKSIAQSEKQQMEKQTSTIKAANRKAVEMT